MTVILEKAPVPVYKDPFADPDILIRIVDDNRATCQSLRFFLEALGYKVRIWTDPLVFMQEYQECSEDGCLILDLRMPGLSGLQVQEKLLDLGVDLPIVFLTGHGDVEVAVGAVKKGAFDFLLKPPSEEKLVKVIEDACRKSLENHAERNKTGANLSLYNALTAREKEVAVLVAKGLMNKVIADKLKISEKTVQQHRGVACHKLGVRSSAELVIFLTGIGVNLKEEGKE